MKSFLEYVAQDIISKYGTNLSHTVVVFPNKRASLFLNDYLARQADRPLWSPVYITISDLFRQQSALTVADPIKQVCDLHKSFCLQTGSDETLDKFYGWGQLLLSDFDDIDKNMADADRVFANLRDLHELDDISYLTEEQREMLRRFFSNFTDEHNSELKRRFLSLWSRMADIYHDFNNRLKSQGLAYEGALYRSVVAGLGGSDGITATTTSFGYDRYLFVGFNLLQKVEQQLFRWLQREGKAHFYWDFDEYYMKGNEAGQYIARYLHDFPNELDTTHAAIYRNFRNTKQFSFIAAPTEDIQARYVSTWLREQQRYQDGRRTAIVLCDENLLPTVIHSLPDEAEKVNITTGYPLSQTPVSSFARLFFDLHLGGRTPRLIRALQRHPYAKYLNIGTQATDSTNPDVTHEPPSVIQALQTAVRNIAQNAKDEQRDPLFQESIFRAYTLINRLNGLIESGDLMVDDVTLQQLIGQMMQQTAIPFHGEPAEGLQIMGVLETRNLDFDHVLLLSCNEGNMPKGVNDSSFIPHSIRHAYELTTVENKVSIYAYYFHRLLQRAHDVTILYNNSTEDGRRGEMSRFMLQLMVESPHAISQHTLQSGQQPDRRKPIALEKTAHVMDILHALFDVQSPTFSILSPTAINNYMRCPLQFYYRYVAGILQPDLPDDEQELDNRIFGNIFHEAADIIYKRLPRYIERRMLEELLKNKVDIERAVDEAFHKELPFAPMGGLHIINREVIIHYLRQLIQIDMQLAPFTIVGLEYDVKRPLHVEGPQPFDTYIGGRIDRLDLVGEDTPQERIRVVDYKTGSRKLKPLASVEAIFDPANIREHSDYYLQTFVYADIVCRQHSTRPVSPALLFIQHAAEKDYDPTLCFGREPITDIAVHADRFNGLLQEKVNEMFSPDTPFVPTPNTDICRSCPYAMMCGR